MIDELSDADQLRASSRDLQDLNEWFVEKTMLPGVARGKRVYINGVLQTA